MKPLQLGDVVATEADTQTLEEWIQYSPKTSIEIGLKNLLNGF